MNPTRRWQRWFGWKTVLTVAFVILVVAVGSVRNGMTSLTPARIDTAETTWREAAIRNYDMQVKTSGAQHGIYDLTVRDGQLKSIKCGGVAADPADGAYWTVEGLFRTLRRELQMANEASATILLADFDRTHGFPSAFLRQVPGSTQTVSVEVVTFRLR